VEEHLGDVLKALGRTKEAKEAWQRSIAVEKNDAVQKKLDQTP
jgi:predicted negative regulator of RcsB-dependent stress response